MRVRSCGWDARQTDKLDCFPRSPDQEVKSRRGKRISKQEDRRRKSSDGSRSPVREPGIRGGNSRGKLRQGTRALDARTHTEEVTRAAYVPVRPLETHRYDAPRTPDSTSPDEASLCVQIPMRPCPPPASRLCLASACDHSCSSHFQFPCIITLQNGVRIDDPSRGNVTRGGKQRERDSP